MEPEQQVYHKKPIGWVKEANKLGRYRNTYGGFRIYVTLEPTSSSSVVEKNGELWNKTEFTRGLYIAVDRYGVTYEGELDTVISKIDIDVLQQKFDK